MLTAYRGDRVQNDGSQCIMSINPDELSVFFMVKRIVLLFLLALFLTQSFASQPHHAKNGIAVSEQRIASQVGIDILRAGGNAIDAAVAMGYALAVVNPCCGNIGGGGFMTVHLANGKNLFINFREKAPLHANRNMFRNGKNKSTKGYLAVGVPGTVLGLDTALQNYGTLSRKQIMLPAIRLAQKGYILTPYEAKQLAQFRDDFREQPNVAAIFLKNGQPYKAGDRLVQRNLANTLAAIAEQGPSVFYKGWIAHTIVDSSKKHGGILTLKDFAQYNVKETAPIECHYRGYLLITAAPPSSGGIALCEMLNILESFPLTQWGYRSAQSIRTIVEAMRYGFADRNRKLGDPDFVNNPVDQLISKNYARQLSKEIQKSHFAPQHEAITFHETTDTTHYSVMDNKGNAVSVTYTLNGFFGARIIAGNTGFFLNNEMDDFATKPGEPNKFGLVQYDKNSIEPGKRPLSSMTPTIVMKEGKIVMVLGSPGGPRIISSVLLTLLNVIDYDMTLQQAIDAPRFHYQGQPDFIEIEPFAFDFLTQKQLQYYGYYTSQQNNWGAVEAIRVDSNTGTFTGGNDSRRPAGAAIGY